MSEPASRPKDSAQQRAESEVRRLLAEHGRLAADAASLPSDADLFRAGLGSQASVTLMLALEEAFGLEFPEEMLTGSNFESIDAILAAVARVRDSGG